MKAVIQRVKKASVKVEEDIVGQIDTGILVLLAIHQDDKEENINKLVGKIIKLRIFSDSQDKMNLSLKDVDGSILVVSQFTLYGDTKKGNRPSFINSANPEKALLFYEKFVSLCRGEGIKTETGKFRAMMDVTLVNDGPVTLIIEI